MSSRKSLLTRFKVEFGAQLVAAAASGLLMVLLARLLGPDDYGLLFLAIAVFGVLGVLSKLGIAKSGARYVAEYKEREPSQLPHIVRTSLTYNVITIAIVGAILFVGHRWVADLIGEPELAPFLLLGVLYLAVETLKVYVRIVLQGFEAIEYASAIYALDQVSRLLFAVGFVLLGFGALGALAGYVLSFALAASVGFGVVYVRLYRPHRGSSPVEVGLRRRIAEYTLPLTATSTANVLDKQVDTILVGLFLNPVAVSYYVLSKQIVTFLEKPVSALGFTLSPTFGAEKASGSIDRAARLYEEALVYSLLLYIPVAAGVVLVAEPTIELVFGTEFLGATIVLQVLAFYAVLQSITKLTSNGLDYLGRAKHRAIVKGITSVLNVLLNIVLIPMIGVVGAAIATVITYSMYTGATFYIIHGEFELRIRYLVHRLLQIVGVTGVMAGVVFIGIGFVGGALSLAGLVLVGIVVWGLLSVVTGLIDPQKLTTYR